MSLFQTANNEFKLSRYFRAKSDPNAEWNDAIKPEAKERPKPKKRPSPISLRLSADEKARLQRDAAGLSLNAYIKNRLFGEDVVPRKTRGKSPVKDHEALARVLSALGQSQLAQDLNDLEWSVEADLVRLSLASEEQLRAACAAVTSIHRDVLRALGQRVE